jgi:hypothetical protein
LQYLPEPPDPLRDGGSADGRSDCGKHGHADQKARLHHHTPLHDLHGRRLSLRQLNER